MHGHRRHISPRRNARYRKIISKVQMCSVSLISKHLKPIGMCQLTDSLDIRTDSIVGRIIDQNSNSTRVCKYRLLNLLLGDTEHYTYSGIYLGIYIHRNCAAEYHHIDYTLMDVSRHDNLIARLAHGQHHVLNRRCSPSDHEKGMLSAERIGCKLLSLLNHRHRMTQIVKRLHGVDIYPDASLPQQVNQLRITPSSLMPRNIERNNSCFSKPLKRLIKRRRGLSL